MLKTFLLSFCILSLQSGCSVQLPSQPYPDSESHAGVMNDVTLIKSDSSRKVYTNSTNDQNRCDVLRLAVSEAQAGDTIELGSATFDCQGKDKGTVFFPDHITVIGKGLDSTHLYSNNYSDGQGSGFEIRNGTFSDLSFENQSWAPFEDGRTIEFYAGYKRTADNKNYEWLNGAKVVLESNPGPYQATFDRVKFTGNAWVVYDWSSRGHRWTIRDSVIVSGRQGISMMGGGGFGAYLEVNRTVFDIDTRRSNDIGATSNATYGGGYGAVIRGGAASIVDSVFKMRCGESGHKSSYVPRCAGVFDGNDFASNSSSHTQITLSNPTFLINGNGSPDTFDILMTNQTVIDNLVLSGGVGSGVSGEILTSW